MHAIKEKIDKDFIVIKHLCIKGYYHEGEKNLNHKNHKKTFVTNVSV